MKLSKFAFFFVFLTVCSFANGGEVNKKPSSQLGRFVKDVIYACDNGDRERISKRLPGEVFLDFHCQDSEKDIVLKYFREFCDLTNVRIGDVRENRTQISFYFGPHEELKKIVKTIESRISMESGCSYWIWWGQDRMISKACVFIANDKISERDLGNKLIKQIFGVFGIPATSDELEDSCLSSKNSNFQSLQPIDKALIKFYYNHVPAGTTPPNLNKIFREKWEE